MDTIKEKYLLQIDQLIAQGQYTLPALLGLIVFLYIFKNEIPKFIGWAFPSKLSKVRNMFDKDLLDSEMLLALKEQYNQACFKKTWHFDANDKLRLKIFELLKQDDNLSMMSFRRAREYFTFKGGALIFDIKYRHYLFASLNIILFILLSCTWLMLYFLIFTALDVSLVKWLSRITILIGLGFVCGALSWEISKFSGARKLNAKINNDCALSIPKFWAHQVSIVFKYIKLMIAKVKD